MSSSGSARPALPWKVTAASPWTHPTQPRSRRAPHLHPDSDGCISGFGSSQALMSPCLLSFPLPFLDPICGRTELCVDAGLRCSGRGCSGCRQLRLPRPPSGSVEQGEGSLPMLARSLSCPGVAARSSMATSSSTTWYVPSAFTLVLGNLERQLIFSSRHAKGAFNFRRPRSLIWTRPSTPGLHPTSFLHIQASRFEFKSGEIHLVCYLTLD